MTQNVSPSPQARPAATLVLMLETSSNTPPAILMVERAQTMAFAAGAVVFPGGRVDADDHELAARFPQIDLECAAARVAAIRETLEECGVAIGLIGDVDHSWISTARQALHDGVLFSAVLDQARLHLDLDVLVPFARWCPNFKEARTFDTRFYLALAGEGLPEAQVDATENVHLFWASAADTLASAEAGDLKIIFPTKRNLERLALFEDFEAAKRHAEATPVDLICPWVDEADGETYLCIPDGLGYPITRESLKIAVRGGQ